MLYLSQMLPLLKLEFQRQSLPCILQLTANNVHYRFKNLLFDFGDAPHWGDAFPLAAQEHVDERKGNREIQLH